MSIDCQLSMDKIASQVILGTFRKVCTMSTRSVSICPSRPKAPIFTTGTLIYMILSTSWKYLTFQAGMFSATASKDSLVSHRAMKLESEM